MFRKSIKVLFYSFCMLLFLAVQNSFSQQYPHYTQYNYNMNVINPAYVGLKQNLQVNILGRTQWTGVEGSPQTGTLSIDSALKENMGIGFSAILDKVGPIKETHLYADFSTTLQVSFKGRLALGLKGGLSFQNIDTSLLNFNQEDVVFNNIQNKTAPNFGFGLYYYQGPFYAGFSVPNVLSLNFSENNVDAIGTVAKETAFYLTSGYVFDISDSVLLKPSFLIRMSTYFPTLMDVSVTSYFNEKFEVGLSYRTNNTLSLSTLFSVNESFKIGYAYDYSISEFSNFNNGSHEIILLFDLLNERRRSGKYLQCF